jgi:SAM-dependent methyltransferase
MLRSRHGAGRVVDIGCATGDFLLEAKARGFEPQGIEPSTWSSTIAKERGLPVFPGFLEDAARQPQFRNQFEYAVLLGVIEHFEDPSLQVSYISSLLADGGHLVLWTGDRKSITSKVLGRYWWYWQGQHIQYFTERSLALLLDRHGFRSISFSLYPYGATTETLMNSLTRYRALTPVRPLIRGMLGLLPKIWSLKLPGEMLCIAEKSAAP